MENMLGKKIEYTIDNFSGILEINEDLLPKHGIIGIYFLLNENKEILYIGKSIASIRSRLRYHLFVETPDTYNDDRNNLVLERRSEIKYFSYIVVPKGYIDMLERYLIYKYKCKFNVEFNYDRVIS